MKEKGFSIVEIIVAMFLFFISLVPLVKSTVENFYTNRKYFILEKRYKNFLAIERQIRNKDINILMNNIGRKSYRKNEFGKDILTEKIYLPYALEEDFKIEIEIKKIKFGFENENYEYLCLKIMYIDSNKNIISEKYIDIDRRKYESKK